MSYGSKIIKNFKRPDPAMIERFRKMPVANIDDNMGRIAAVDAAIYPVNKGVLCGPAFTVRAPQGDNLMFHAAMDLAQPGDVIVIDGASSVDRSIFGELMATYCQKRGIAGIVCDGAVRDIESLSAMVDFPIYARGVTPNGPYKNGPGEINTTVSIGTKVVNPGDIIVGDADGVIIVPVKDAEEIAVATEATMAKEAGTMEEIMTKGTFLRPWVDAKLAELGYEIVEE